MHNEAKSYVEIRADMGEALKYMHSPYAIQLLTGASNLLELDGTLSDEDVIDIVQPHLYQQDRVLLPNAVAIEGIKGSGKSTIGGLFETRLNYERKHCFRTVSPIKKGIIDKYKTQKFELLGMSGIFRDIAVDMLIKGAHIHENMNSFAQISRVFLDRYIFSHLAIDRTIGDMRNISRNSIDSILLPIVEAYPHVDRLFALNQITIEESEIRIVDSRGDKPRTELEIRVDTELGRSINLIAQNPNHIVNKAGAIHLIDARKSIQEIESEVSSLMNV